MGNFIIRPTKDFFAHSIIEPEDNRVIKKDGYIIKPTKDSLIHSAKGSQWEKHDYIAVKDGKYYYPDDYEGGRHLPKDRRQLQQEAIKDTAGEPQGWEQAFYGEWEKNLKTMNKALHAFVYLFLVLAGAALWFELQLNAKRTLLTDRNRLQEDTFIKIAKTIEKDEAAKDPE